MSLNHGAAFHQKGGCLGNQEDLEAQLGENEVQLGEGGGFTSTWASSEANSDDWELTLPQDLWMIESSVFHSCRMRRALGDIAGCSTHGDVIYVVSTILPSFDIGGLIFLQLFIYQPCQLLLA